MNNNVLKSILSVALTAVITAVSVTGVTAKIETDKFIYKSDSGYTATKISHPDKDVKTTDGIVDYTGNGTLGVNLENGEGDRGQNYSWASVGYGDYMYIGNCLHRYS